MRRLLLAVAFAAIGTAGARADLVITVDKSHQRMSVAVNGESRYNWPVSTARAGYTTPNGTYHPELLARRWFSRKYYNSPMPHSIFFHGGYAIHGSYEISHLGGPASHGCVRLNPEHAAVLYALVQEEGMAKTAIVVTGPDPARPHLARAHRPYPYYYAYPGYFGGGFYGRF